MHVEAQRRVTSRGATALQGQAVPDPDMGFQREVTLEETFARRQRMIFGGAYG